MLRDIRGAAGIPEEPDGFAQRGSGKSHTEKTGQAAK